MSTPELIDPIYQELAALQRAARRLVQVEMAPDIERWLKDNYEQGDHSWTPPPALATVWGVPYYVVWPLSPGTIKFRYSDGSTRWLHALPV